MIVFIIWSRYNKSCQRRCLLEIYDLLEAKVGKEEAREVGKILTASLETIEKKAEAVAVQMKVEIKDELTKELATKEDLARHIGAVMAEIVRLNGKMDKIESDIKGELKEIRAEMKGENRVLRLEQKIIFLILASIILLTNPKALELIARLFGLAK